MVAMPLFHVGGSSYVQFGIHDGIPSVMTRDVDGAALAGAILQGANRTFLVPAVLAKVLDSGLGRGQTVRRAQDLRLRCLADAAAALARRAGGLAEHRLHPGVRLTEVCGVISHLLPEAHRSENVERLSSAGTLVPNAEVRVVDPDTLEDVPPANPGRIVVPLTAIDEGLPQQAGGDRRGDHRGRLVPHRRHRPRRRRTATSSSRTGSRT